jgi:YD repeat-containing protein
LLDGTAAIASSAGSVDASTGAFDTSIALPAYNPNIPGLTLTYDSLAANPMPIFIERHTLDDSQSVPTYTSVLLTFNSVPQTTYYYDSSKLTPGDVEEVAQQASATSLSTGRYPYSFTVADTRSTTTTNTVSGNVDVVNDSSSNFGAGWTLAGLARVYSFSGGVILTLGEGGRSLWFASSGSGGGYTTPNGDFSTLTVSGSGGSAVYTRTLAEGTEQQFRGSDGRETNTVDRNGLRVTYTYSSGGQLSTITDPYNKTTSFGYDSGGNLATITDPASRIATFTVSGGTLTTAKLPDNAVVSFAYDASKRMTQVTDPRGNTLTVSYDSAGRAATLTRPDSSTQLITPYQEAGYSTSGTSSGSPATAILLAESQAV